MKKFCYLLSFAVLINIVSLSGANGSELTSDQALQKLKDGNKRYINNNRLYPNLNQSKRELSSKQGQFPFASIIGCSDSRVPIEHIFDVGIGDVFVIRVAGNVCDVDETGSIEYGVEHLKTPLLIVLGHSGCGAVTAVVRDDEVHGSIPALIDNIYPAVSKAKEEYGEQFSDELLKSSIELNVWQSIEDLLKNSPAVVELVKNGELKIIGAVYNLTTGEVQWLGEHPQLESLLSDNAGAHNTNSHIATQKKEYNTVEESAPVFEASFGSSSNQGSGNIRVIVIVLILFIALVYFLLLNKRTTLKLMLRSKIMSIAVVLLIILTGLGIVNYIYMRAIGEELYGIAEEDVKVMNKVTEIQASQSEQGVVIERILKHFYNNSISNYDKTSSITELEAEFAKYSELANKELTEAEEICKNAMAHEKKEKAIKEFQDVLNVLSKIEKEHKDFETEAEVLFESVAQGNTSLIAEQEELIEKETDALAYEIDSILLAFEGYTADAAYLAESHEKEATAVNIVLILIAVLIGSVLSYMLSSLITKPILKTVELAEKISNGDLTHTIVVEQDDEIGKMADSLSRMVEKLKHVATEIITGSDNIASASQQISSSSQELSQGANEQAASVEEISSTMEQMASNIGQNTENAEQTEKIASIAQKGIQEVNDQSKETIHANKLISENINIITDIAFQTNILALNAAVEAARAGEHGKGFAVVAAEVRKLAERSKVAAGEIIGLAKNSLELAERAGKKMEDILPEVAKTSHLVKEISAASQEQNNGATQVTGAIQQLNAVIQQYAASSEELATSSEEMNSQAEQLRDIIGFFKTGSDEKNNFKSRALKETARRHSVSPVNLTTSGIKRPPTGSKSRSNALGQEIQLLDENESEFEQY